MIKENEYAEKQKNMGYLLPENWQKRLANLDSLIGQISEEKNSDRLEELRKKAIEAWTLVKKDYETLERNLKEKGLL